MFTWIVDTLLIFAIIAPLVGLAGKKLKVVKEIVGVYTVVGFLLAFVNLYYLYLDVNSSHVIVVKLVAVPGSCLKIDMLSVFLATIFLLLGVMASIFSIRYMEHDTGVPEYYALLLAMVSGMIGTVFAGDFFTLFLFWELMCIASYVLVAFRKEKWEPVEAGFKYLIMSAMGSALILFSIALLYGMTGTVNLSSLASAIASQPLASVKQWIYLTIALIIAGFGIKAAIVPLHSWLPDAHPAAPSPISAMLSGVVIKTGVYAVIRLLFLVFIPVIGILKISYSPIIGPIDWNYALLVLAIFALVTMTVGNLMALQQTDIKRLLAFSSIAQMGYILLAVSVGTVLGLTAGLLHVMNHAIMKGLLFLCAGAFVHAVGTRNLDELTGIGHKMNITGVIFTVGALAISGIPPLNGFVSEFMIVFSAFDAKLTIFAVIMLINILIGFGYYLRLLYILVWKAPGDNLAKVKEAPVTMLLPMGILMLLCVIIGIWPGPFIDFASRAAQAISDITTYITAT